ncbi:ABC transporter ATP-binding protein [Streptomyces yaizuensis]|uniref:ABC transporter ATP-binding protein n=1 Tax=Streptomyces yaizuensis TaxID=2989713 RepID=A0ABQ5NXL7_9ACTN|nr:ABC transporter ATP-binding protein [Streptomyces sp. YSPA8]GLF94898.1 ABC transporter ATP-binding protein [Streptomyces sp. YSPA8]
MTDDSYPYALEARGLGKKYLRGLALQDCSFRLPAGTITALVGPNGAGKSTFLRIAARLIRPSTGRLRIFGTDVTDAAALDRVALVDQDKPLYKGFTVAETLRLGRELNPRWDQAAAERIVAAGQVPFDAKVGTLSGGQRTRVALALAFGKQAELLLLDEPMADLDPLARHELSALLIAEAAERGTTVLMSSHLVSELEEMCDHLLVLAGGRLRMAGATDELLPAHLLVTGLADPGARPAGDGVLPPGFAERHTVIDSRVTGRQFTALIRAGADPGDQYNSAEPTLEEVLLGYLRSPGAPSLITPDTAVTTATTATTAPAGTTTTATGFRKDHAA